MSKCLEIVFTFGYRFVSKSLKIMFILGCRLVCLVCKSLQIMFNFGL